MQGAGWIDLIRRIPAKMRDSLCFATVNGSEIMSQDIFRLDREFILLRGRMGGSQDAGKIIILPYDQIVNLTINKVLKDEEIQKIFGKGSPLPPATEAVAPESELPIDDFAEMDDSSPQDLPSEVDEIQVEEPAGEFAVNLTTASRQSAKPEKKGTGDSSSAPRPPEISKSILLARLRQRLAEQSKQQP